MGQLHFEALLHDAQTRLAAERPLALAVSAVITDAIGCYELARQLLRLDRQFASRLQQLYDAGRIQVYERSQTLGLVRCHGVRGDEFAFLLPDYPGIFDEEP